MTVSPVFEIYGAAQSYDWGTLGKNGSKVAQFAKPIPGFQYDENKPYAEVRLCTRQPHRIGDTEMSELWTSSGWARTPRYRRSSQRTARA